MRHRSIALAVGALVLAACGGAAEQTSPTAPPAEAAADTGAAPTATPSDDAGATDTADTTPPHTDTDDPPAADTTDTTDPIDTTDTTDTSDTMGSTDSPADTGTDPTTAAPTTAAPSDDRPDDGCSADNAPGATDVAEGPRPSIEVREASLANPLPDVAVRRINCAGGWVNIKNEVPADRPVLIWLWAPH